MRCRSEEPAALPGEPPPQNPGFDLTARPALADHPFRHVYFGPGTALGPEAVSRLLETFPAGPALRSSSRATGSDKTYRVNTVTLYHQGGWTPAASELHPYWQKFAAALADPGYLAALAGLLGLPSEPVDLELRLAEYPHGGWMSRHTDRPDKLFSQNIYLCPGWRPEWGGGLALYQDDHAPDPAAVFVPGAGNSLAFARHDRSWHEVMRVSGHASMPRRTVLIHGYRAARCTRLREGPS